MDLKTIIEVKSIDENYKKEKSGVKNNTVRLVNVLEDNILNLYIDSSYTNSTIQYIKIKHVNGKDSFIRELTDITRYVPSIDSEVIYIFTWER